MTISQFNFVLVALPRRQNTSMNSAYKLGGEEISQKRVAFSPSLLLNSFPSPGKILKQLKFLDAGGG